MRSKCVRQQAQAPETNAVVCQQQLVISLFRAQQQVVKFLMPRPCASVRQQRLQPHASGPGVHDGERLTNT